MLVKNKKVTKKFNQYVGYTTDSVNLYESPQKNCCEALDDIYNIICKFRNNPSIIIFHFSFRNPTGESDGNKHLRSSHK